MFSKWRFILSTIESDNRIEKIEEISKVQGTSFMPKFKRTHNLKEASLLPDGTHDVSASGRIMASRLFGKLCFIKISDWEGSIQVALEKNTLGDKEFAKATKLSDIGDHIGVKGEIITTKTGEKTILASEFIVLSKAIRPLPEKWHGLTDTESCYRQRYLDLIMNKEIRDVFKLRTKVIRSIRDYLDKHGFEEVDTPVLVIQKSGALAKPFITHHNALDMDVYLRIAPETYLKRCIAGGYDRVYEFARVFRNEGIDASHLQDFTMLEYYCAYWDFEDNMTFTENLIKNVLMEVIGKTTVTFNDKEIDLGGSWRRVSFREILKEHLNLDISQYPDAERLRKAISDTTGEKVDTEDWEKLSRGSLMDKLYKLYIRPNLIEPTFITYHPIDLSPLARRNDVDPSVADRFQLLINSWEIVNAYSELIDPIDQRHRLETQALAHTQGDEDALDMDEDYIKCLEHGLPPVSGWGMGIDRFVALLTGRDNLRDVILFPLLKPLQNTEGEKMVQETSVFPNLNGLKINKAQAEELFRRHVTSDNLTKHCLASAAVMRSLARYFKQDEDKWYILGLIHDLDFETNKEPSNHGLRTAEILRSEGISEDVVSLILSHNAEGLGLQRTTHLEHLLSAAESVTGLIAATALVYPDKKLQNVEVRSVTKRMGKKDFARAVSRESIRECEQAGLTLDEFVGLALEGMKEIAPDLGL